MGQMFIETEPLCNDYIEAEDVSAILEQVDLYPETCELNNLDADVQETVVKAAEDSYCIGNNTCTFTV